MIRIIILSILILVGSIRTVFCMTNWESYISSPGCDNAEKVKTVEYSSKQNDDYLISDLQILENQVISGDKCSINLAFRLLEKSDGIIAESIDIILGKLIRIDPGLFLSALDNNRNRKIDINSLACNLGEGYVDNLSAMMYEINMRIQAIEKVRDKRLISTREKVLKVLREHLDEISSVEKSKS